MRKINKLGRRAAALVLAVGLTLSTAAPVLAADADEVQTPAAQTEQQETDTEADEADVDTEADEAAALPELSEDREVAEEDEAVALPELSEDRAVAEEDEAAALPELSEDREVAEEDEAVALPELSEDREAAGADAELYAWKPHSGPCERSVLLETQAATCTTPERKKWKCTKNFHFNNWWEDTAPALGHDMSDWIVVEATCTTAGEKYQACHAAAATTRW